MRPVCDPQVVRRQVALQIGGVVAVYVQQGFDAGAIGERCYEGLGPRRQFRPRIPLVLLQVECGAQVVLVQIRLDDICEPIRFVSGVGVQVGPGVVVGPRPNPGVVGVSHVSVKLGILPTDALGGLDEGEVVPGSRHLTPIDGTLVMRDVDAIGPSA